MTALFSTIGTHIDPTIFQMRQAPKKPRPRHCDILLAAQEKGSSLSALFFWCFLSPVSSQIPQVGT